MLQFRQRTMFSCHIPVRSRRLVIDSDSDDGTPTTLAQIRSLMSTMSILNTSNQSFNQGRTSCTIRINTNGLQYLETRTRCIRFDDKNTRRERRESDRLAPMYVEKFIENCKKWYKPGSYITVDEQLVGFRGRCPFRMYIPNKPNKYGLKLVMVADSSTKNLKLIIAEILKINDPQEGPSHDVPKTRKLATSVLQKRRMTTTFCKVQNTDLQEHVVSMCNLCSG
ncbi:hypothetical protein EVAR_91866_1 [Eumeta japonica]|uniref:PiggyBac transposable element-derived protein domain-containing protein n=1 Tax=Eumeta variegata TaxID=151549 RepID=A0A4C1SAY2_EUMVA|nr:hypothetical protein EVAR_91866_1 [Eumeta japonica]